MATVLVSVQEYLGSVYSPDAEYIDGIIEERPMGEWDHAAWQVAIAAFFFNRSDAWAIRVRPEQRTQTGERRYRVPDVAIFDAAIRPEPVAVVAPLLVFEILSREDRLPRVLPRLSDLAQMGVPGLYVVQPEDSALMEFVDGGLRLAEVVRLRERRILWAEIAATVR
jgi:Uma2 family endonuclease